MAVNLQKNNRKKVNLTKEIKRTKASVQNENIFLDPNIRYDSPTINNSSAYNPKANGFENRKKSLLWICIPIATVLLIAFLAVLIFKSSGKKDDNITAEYDSTIINNGAGDVEKDNTDAGTEAYEIDKGMDDNNQDTFSEQLTEESEINEIQANTDTNEVIHADNKSIHDYEVITADITWEEAFEDCIRRGGYLCRINTEEENEKIKQMLDENNIKGVVFLGGLRTPDSHDYHWIDSNREAFDETINSDDNMKYWLDGEPSFSDHVDDEEISECYMSIIYPGSLKDWVWNDVSNDVLSLAPDYYTGRLSYICEYE